MSIWSTRVERHVRILGWLWIAFSAIITVAAAIGALVFLLVVTNGDKTAGELLFLALGSLIGIIGGIGVLRMVKWARFLILILGALNLLSFPFGTALGVYTLWVLTKRETARLFG